MNWGNILERAGWTFLQAGLASIPAAISVSELTDKEWWLAIGVAGFAAVLSFLKTVAQEQLESRRDTAEGI